MILIESASALKTNPRTLQHKQPCMCFKFDTGHKYEVWTDGTEFFFNKSGRGLNTKSGHKLIAEMRKQAKTRIV